MQDSSVVIFPVLVVPLVSKVVIFPVFVVTLNKTVEEVIPVLNVSAIQTLIDELHGQNVTTAIAQMQAKISTLETSATTNTGKISTLETSSTTHTGKITTLETDLGSVKSCMADPTGTTCTAATTFSGSTAKTLANLGKKDILSLSLLGTCLVTPVPNAI